MSAKNRNAAVKKKLLKIKKMPITFVHLNFKNAINLNLPLISKEENLFTS